MGTIALLALLALPADAPVEPPLTPAPLSAPAPAPPPLAAGVTAFERSQFPRIPALQFFKGMGLTAARPFNPQPEDLFVIAPAMLATVITYNTDIETHRAIKGLPDPQLGDRRLSYYASELGEGWVDLAVFLGLGLLGGRDGQRACLAGVQALVATALFSRVGKAIVRLERPSFDPDAHHIGSRFPQADAMPSGHTMSAFATAAVLASEYRTLAPLWYALAAWVGVARVQQSTHWLSDVVVGAALGTLFGWEAYRVTRLMELEVQPWANTTGGGLTVARSF
ncbi:MAG: phosphatase PAP2 family protein [Myxococcaceae bacterium]|nr:phosphatase PAP2 family protein [Myxococcaceae bacterium]